MSDAARGILVAGAQALSRVDGLGPSLRVLLDAIAEEVPAASAAILTVDRSSGDLAIVASYGLGDAAAAGLAEAVRNPRHPIARTVATPIPSFDVAPTAPGGPALRSHLPLIVTRAGADVLLGVLALAHDATIDPSMRSIIQAGADLAAAVIERDRP